MSDLVQVKIDLFGPFREANKECQLELHVSPDARIFELKQALSVLLPQSLQNLLEVSVMATDRAILAGSDKIGEMRSFALLAPVCGG